MSQSFSAKTTTPLGDFPKSSQKVLVTGAAGNIGSYFANHARDKYQLRLMVRKAEESTPQLQKCGDVIVADLGDLQAVEQACQGIDVVLHLAGNPSPVATWNDLLQSNIIGTYHTLVAAKHAGCHRVVLASSIHAVSGYPPDVQVKTTDPVNPEDLYGVTKCFGEALGRYMATQEKLSVLAIRIGAFQPLSSVRDPGGINMLDSFVSQRDLQQLLEKAIEVTNLQFGIFHGLSDNHFKRLDITDAKELLGYAPVDDSAKYVPQLADTGLNNPPEQKPLEQRSGLREEIQKLDAD